jgi:hypothetical protein
MHPLEKELIEAEFDDLLYSVKKGDVTEAKKLAVGLRQVLDKMDKDYRDETLDFVSNKVAEIGDPELFDKTVEFLVEHQLSEGKEEHPFGETRKAP